MADYDTLESSLQGSRPVELYEFTLGSTVYRYSAGEDNVVVGAPPQTYVAEPGISRGRLTRGAQARSRDMEINVSSMNEVAQRYVGIPPTERGEFSAYRVQRDETPSLTAVLIFAGQIKSVQFSNDGTSAKIRIQTIESSRSMLLPRFTCMGSCNNFLYDQFCGIDPSLHNHIGTVVSQTGKVVEVDGVGASPHDFVAGFCSPVSGVDFRQVFSVSGDFLTLDLPLGDLVGQSLQVYAGCDRIIDSDCALVFDNVIEFGGFAFVPNRNPFETGI